MAVLTSTILSRSRFSAASAMQRSWMIARGRPYFDGTGRLDQRREIAQRAPVNLALEIHHMLGGIPEIHPAPNVELGAGMRVQPERGVDIQHPEQEPHLLLADAGRVPPAPHITRR